ncbi:hypothetical protein BgiMline_010005 [Biomphalaria glabrata]
MLHWSGIFLLTFGILTAVLFSGSIYGGSVFKIKPPVNGYQAEIMSCTTDKVARTDKLQEPIGVVSQVHCAQFCAKELLCDLALYQTFANGSKSCTLLQQLNLSNSSDRVDFTSSVKCSLILSNPCLNGGLLENEICVCKPDFSGERCEYVNPQCCSGNWNVVYTSTSFNLPPYYSRNLLHRAKLRYTDASLNVKAVLRSALVMTSATEEFSFQSLQTMEKSSWNSVAANPTRRFIHFRDDGSYQIASFNLARNSYTSLTGAVDFDLIVRDPIYLLSVPSNALNSAYLTAALSEGFEHYEQTTTALNDSQNIVFQMTDVYKTTVTGQHFTVPPEWYNFKLTWTKYIDVARIAIGQGMFTSIERNAVSGASAILNVCWMPLSLDKSGKLQPRKLAGYLQKGHSVKVFFDNVYYNVIEVVEFEGQLHFFLAHHMTKTGLEPLDDQTFGVKSIISSEGVYQTCTHVLEGETVKATATGVTTTLGWFVDTKTWALVYSVYSNKSEQPATYRLSPLHLSFSVNGGSLSVLAQAVLDGRDVRVWVKWLLYDKSRYMETQQSSVTPSGKVSTEGVVTWDTVQLGAPNVTLSPDCGYKYILVTSDGYMETVVFNVFTPATKMVVSNVLITWFVN